MLNELYDQVIGKSHNMTDINKQTFKLADTCLQSIL